MTTKKRFTFHVSRFTPTYVMARKDLNDMLNSPIAYVFFVIFSLVTGYFFSQTLFLIKQANLSSFLDLVPLILVFLVPAITMRSFSEEFRGGTFELLATLPLKTYEIVLGKFLACWSLILICLGATLIYPLILEILGNPDWGAVFGAYLGFLGLTASLCSIGVYLSSVTRNQVIAYLAGWGIAFIFFMAAKVQVFAPYPISSILNFLGFDSHIDNIARGLLDTRDILYFLSVSVFFLSLCLNHIEMKYRNET